MVVVCTFLEDFGNNSYGSFVIMVVVSPPFEDDVPPPIFEDLPPFVLEDFGNVVKEDSSLEDLGNNS